MSMDNFLSYLQQLLTMVEPGNASSITLAKTALTTIIELARISNKADTITIRAMMNAESYFGYLVEHREDYIGVPGEYQKNQIKRQRLSHVVVPTC